MVGHTGVPVAVITAVETVDRCLGKIVTAAEASGTRLLITADHGNCEMMIDPETGERVVDGEEGELALTSLTREAMPLIRYRTGDLTSFIPDPCPCGRTHRRLSRIQCRTDDMFIVRGVNIFPLQIERVLMSMPQVGRNYVIVLDREGYADRLTVRVELNADAFFGELEQLQSLRERIADRLRREIMVRPRIELVEPGTIPRQEGKAVRVIDERKD